MITELEIKGQEILDRVKALTISTPEAFREAGEWLVKIAGHRKEITDFFEPTRKQWWTNYKDIQQQIKDTVEPYDIAERALRDQRAAYRKATTLAGPIQTAVSMFAPPPVKEENITEVTRWVGEVTDLSSLLSAVISGKAPMELIVVDQKLLNKMATSMREAFNVPGARAVKETMDRVTG